MTSPPVEPCSVFRGLDDEAWFRVLVRSIEEPVIDGVPLPRFPPRDFQAATVGAVGVRALSEAFDFWRVVRSYATRAGVPMAAGTRVLDFGCGWGRMARIFLRDLRSDDVWGVDVGRDMLSFCAQLFRHGHFERVPPSPPTTLPTSTFDVVYAYSVFSHLNEAVHLMWVRELARVLRPGGLLVVTTRSRGFIDLCARLRQEGHPADDHALALSRLFPDSAAAHAAYDRGAFLHFPTGGGVDRPPSFYGETVIPRKYVERNWTSVLDFVDFTDDSQFLWQALIVMRKPTR